ncbi:MAG TPA: hypothetical protein DFS52_02025 [Myxococcales bacterium]|jgi:predicted transcriptional regulator|nr:hypothetical protein [Myxococcales bacterium]
MATTTLKLPEGLKEHIAALARRAGKSPHCWMVEALEREAALTDLREAFLREAEQSARDIDAGGPLYAAEDVHAYLAAKAAGRVPRRPTPIKRTRSR